MSRIKYVMTLIVLVIVIVYNAGEILKTSAVQEVVRDQSMFSIPAEMSERYDSCEYRYLFFCGQKSSAVPAACANLTGFARASCILTDNGEAGSGAPQASSWQSLWFVRMIVTAVVTLPRLPDATIHMLQDRWRRGSLQFSLGLVFVAVYLTLMVVTLRSTNSARLWMCACVVVTGPYLIAGIFWLLQQALTGASEGAEKFTALMVSVLGLPGCLLVCIQHDAESLVKVVKGIH
jgi:hypothetical protein